VLFRREGLARQQCLVDKKIPGLEEASIRWDQVPGGEQHDIARDEVLPEHRDLQPIPQDLLFEGDRDLEMLGGLLRAVFLHGLQHRAHQHDCRNDDEAGQVPGERGNRRSRQQDQHKRVAESAQEFERQRKTPPLLEGVRAVAEPACHDFSGAKAVSVGSELLLEISERDLPEFGLRPALRCHRQPLPAAPLFDEASKQDASRPRNCDSSPRVIG